jgi:hypothetical protein
LRILPVAFFGSSERISARLGTLNADRCWAANHRALEYARVGIEHLLDLARIEVFAAAETLAGTRKQPSARRPAAPVEERIRSQ